MRTTVLMIAVCLGLSTAVIAQPKEKEGSRAFQGPKHEMRQDQPNAGPLSKLGLSDAQKESFRQGRLTMQKQLLPLRNELREALAHQKTLMSAEKPDLGAVNKNIEKMGNLKVEMAKIRAKNRVDMLAQLTDEQRMKLDAMKANYRGERTKGLQGMHGRL